MKICIRFFFILCLIPSSLSCQSTNIIDCYEYQVGGITISSCKAEITNTTKEGIVFWFDKEETTGKGIKEKIHSYFFKRKKDFSFYNLLTENLINKLPLAFFDTFIKKINSEESFTIRIVSNNLSKDKLQIKFEDFLKKYLVTITYNKFIYYLKLKENAYPWYKRNEIVLYSDNIF